MTHRYLSLAKETFKTISDPNADIADVLQVMPIIEKFIVVYGVTDEGLVTVNDARLHLFDKGKDFENLPPCYDSLLLHVLRSTYQVRSFITVKLTFIIILLK